MNSQEKWDQFQNKSPTWLAEQIENPAFLLEERLIIGQILAIKGDPRIQVFQPKMISIPGARVRIGLPANLLMETWKNLSDCQVELDWIEKEVPQHEVDIQPFKIAKYPVTHQEYFAYLKDSEGGEIPTSWLGGTFPMDRADHPVNTITPHAAELYCNWLSKKTGRKFRLPSEYEWEYAASGPKSLEYPWGHSFHPSFANTLELGLNSTTPIEIFVHGNTPSGITDLAGNVEEIQSNTYFPYSNGKEIIDHFSEKHGRYRITRGGAYNRRRDVARCRRRHGWSSDTQAIGFRVAEIIEG